MIENELSRPFDLEKIKKEFSLDIKADEKECSDLAKRFQIKQINMFEANCMISRLDKKQVGDFQLKGKLFASVIQQCVMTLDDIEEKIEEDFLIIFCNGTDPSDENSGTADLEIDPNDDDIEYIGSPNVDIGEYLAEYLSLALNPYPKRSKIDRSALGYEILSDDQELFEEEKKNPFGVLADLKHKT